MNRPPDTAVAGVFVVICLPSRQALPQRPRLVGLLVTNTQRPGRRLRKLFLRRSVPYGLFALTCGLAAAASWYVSSTTVATAEAQARSEFVADAEQMQRQMQAGVDTYLEVVRVGAVLFGGDNEMNGADFRRFVSGLQVLERYPGMEGIGFAQCASRQNLARLLRIIALDGNRVRAWPPPAQANVCPTIFLEPGTDRNAAAVGFDLASDPALAEAMTSARDTAQAAATRKLTDVSVWQKGWQGDIVIFMPVYRFAASLSSIAARQQALIGFVFSPLTSERLLEHVLASRRPSIAFDVYEGGLAVPNRLLGQSGAGAATPRYESVRSIHVAGREWVLRMRSTDEPVGIASDTALQTLVAGILLALMVLWVTRAQVRAWENAARHEAELRASQEALRESESQARAANRAKDEFLAILSHELRTPLNVVLGWVSMLREGSVREDRAARALDVIERNARQQAELIDDLLDVSRIVTGKMRLELRPVACAPIIAAVVESLRPTAQAKAVTITLAPFPEESTIRGDADRLHQIAWNLLSNAIKFTPSNGHVWVELTRDEQHVTLAVRDTGIGIAPEFLPHVFERFRQADSSTTRAHSGVGLGLAIARHLVELHGGTIKVDSEGRDRGATFTLQFPAVPVSAVTTHTAPLAAFAPRPAPRLDGIRVLVVDDDPNTLDLLTEALGTTGARVTAAASAPRALEQLNSARVDVIVSDIAMPGEDGFWLMERIRALPGDVGRTPAIALTALARREDRARALAAGYQMHLAKPVELGELQAGVANLAAHSRAS
jgi:signal transduction histidine kinase/ActR/RegA family two-component response regulator